MCALVCLCVCVFVFMFFDILKCSLQTALSSRSSANDICFHIQDCVQSSAIMRLLRQISLDGSTWRHSGISNSCATTTTTTTTTSATNSTSTTSSGKQSTSCSSSSNTNTPTSSSSSNSIIINTRSSGSIERLGCNFAAQFFQTITVCNELLHAYDSNEHSSGITTETNSTTSNTTDNSKQRKSSKSTNQNIVLRILEQLNGLIVHLIQLTTTTTAHQESSTNAVNNNNNNKSSSRLRRQYSELLEGAPFFRIKRSMSASSGEECSRLSAVGGSKKSEESEDAFSLTPICGCSLEQAIDRLTESGCLALIVRALPSIGFEEKKLARLILTNSMILKLNGRHPIVHYFCDDDSNPITSTDASEDNRLERSPNHHDDNNNNVLRLLVQSYSLARSDVTLNCGRILRFASQYRPVVETLIRSPQLFYQFFDYMQSRALPFDVTMDAFYTFKCIMTRHKTITAEMLRADDRSSGAFFDAIVRLLRHAEQQQNYVTKRQTLEIFADIFAGDEWAPLRTQFIESDRRIGPVIENLVNRNVQVRLRCVVLINQLFRVAPEAEQPGDHQDATPDRASCSGERNAKIPLQALWRWKLLREKLMQIDLCDSMIEIDDRLRSEWMQNLWRRLRDECAQSNVKQFTSQIPFVDLALQNLI